MRNNALVSARRIRDLFRLARLLAEDRPTQEGFARKVLGIASVHLSYIEGGKRLPSEGLVRNLLTHESLESETPRFLEMLARERAVRNFLRDLERVYGSGKKSGDAREPGDSQGLYKAITRAIAILSEGEPIAAAGLTRRLRRDKTLKTKGSSEPTVDPARAVEHLLSTGLATRRADGTLVLKTTHYTPGSFGATLEYLRASTEFFLDSAVKASLSRAPDSFLYDVYLDIEPGDIAAFQREVYERIRDVVKRHEAKRGPTTRFVKMLVASSTED